jgi:Phage gp6-like head-tail connector protein
MVEMIAGTIQIDDVDYNALPKALLATAKSHLRVDFSDDDEYIKDCIKRAISLFERESEISVNPSSYIWKPDPADFCDGAVKIPFSPVVDLSAIDGDENDVTGDYLVASNSTHGVMLYRLIGDYVDGLTVNVDSGYASKDELEPGILDIVLLLSCHFYENRGVLLPANQIEDFLRRMSGSYWTPRL